MFKKMLKNYREKKRIKQNISEVKKQTNHSVNIVTKNHSIAFGIFFVAEKVIDYYFYPCIPDGIVKIIIIALVALLLYPLIYFCVNAFMDMYIEKSKKKYDIQGEWYHVHIPHIAEEIDYTREALSCGITTIGRELNDFALKGENEDYYVDANNQVVVRTGRTTSRHTVISEISEDSNCDYDIIQIYNSTTNVAPNITIRQCPCCGQEYDTPIRVREAATSRYGIHKYTVDSTSNINGKGYTRIKARYVDAFPSLKIGELLLYRNKDERDARIKEYFAEKEQRC